MKILKTSNKYENTFLFSVFLFGIAGIFLTFLLSFGLGESGYNFLHKTKKVTLSPGAPVTQTFTSHANNLHQVRFVLGNGSIKSGESIELQLLNSTCQETLATQTLHTEPTKQGVYTVFSFSPLPDSLNQSYCFSATYISDENRKGDKPYLSATDEPSAAFSDRILTDTNKNKVYPGQTLFLRPAYTSGNISSDLWNLVERLTQYKPSFFQGWSLIILFLTLIVGSIALAYTLLFTRKEKITSESRQ